MKKHVEPPRPITLLAFFSFIMLAVSMFVFMPLFVGIVALVVAAFEIAGSNAVSGDFSSIMFGTVLWKIASWPFYHWIVSSSIVVVGTVFLIFVTVAINRR